MRRLASGWIFKIILALLLVSLGWTAWYFYRRGFTREWRAHLVEELRKQGIEVSINRMTLDPVRGIIVHGVVIYDSPARHWVLAELNRAALDVNVSAMLRGKAFLNGIDFRDAEIDVPLDSRTKDSESVRIRRCWAKVYFIAGSIVLRRAVGEVEGLHFSASGALLHGPKIEISDEPPLADERGWLEPFLASLKELRWKDQAPQLNLDFAGSASDEENLRLSCTFAGSELTWREAVARSLDVKLKFEGKHLLLDRALWIDRSGELRLQGTCNLETRAVWFRGESSINPKPLLASFPGRPPLFDVIRFPSSPSVTAEGELWRADAGFGWHVTGDVRAARLSLRSLAVENFGGSFAWERDRWFVREVEFDHGSGSIRGDAMSEPGRLRIRVESDLNPEALTSILGKRFLDYLADWHFTRPPWINLHAEGSGPGSPLSVKGEAALGRCSFQGTAHRSGRVKFSIENDQIHYEEIRFDPVQ